MNEHDYLIQTLRADGHDIPGQYALLAAIIAPEMKPELRREVRKQAAEILTNLLHE